MIYNIGAISFKLFLELDALWFGVTCPLTFMGSLLAFKMQPIKYPSPVGPVALYI